MGILVKPNKSEKKLFPIRKKIRYSGEKSVRLFWILRKLPRAYVHYTLEQDPQTPAEKRD